MRLITIVAGVVLAVVYFSLFSYAGAGYGYPGYGGHYAGPSIWYFGGPSYYRGASLRSGSRSGPGGRGSGLSYGK